MADDGSSDPAAAPIAGAGSAQEAAELPVEDQPEAPASNSTVPAAAPDAAAPLREDQIANAVSFLSHDKARPLTHDCAASANVTLIACAASASAKVLVRRHAQRGLCTVAAAA